MREGIHVHVGLRQRNEKPCSVSPMEARTPDPLTLLSAVREMIDAPSPDAVIARVLGIVKETMQVEAAYWMDIVGDRAEMRAVVGLGRPQLMLGTSVATSEGIGGIALATGKPCFADDYLSHPAAVPYLSEFVRDEGISGLMAVPVFRDEHTTAILYLLSRGKRTFTPDDEHYLLVLSSLAAHIESQHSRTETLVARLSGISEDAEARLREGDAVVAFAARVLDGEPSEAAIAHASRHLRAELGLHTPLEAVQPPSGGTLVPGTHGTYLTVADTAAVSEGGRQLLTVVAGLALARQRAVVETRILLEGKFVHDLMHGSSEDLGKVASSAYAAGIDIHTPRRVVAIGGQAPIDQRWLDQFVSALHRTTPGVIAAVHEGRLVVLWPSAGAEVSTSSIARQVSRLLSADKEQRFTAGLGGEASLSDPQLPVAVREALFAQRISQFRSPASGVFDIENAGMYRIFAQVASVDGLRDSVRESVGKLFEEDQQKGSQLALTLRTYLEHDRRINETAKALNLHPNSLRYRIERIGKLLGIELSDPDTRFFTLIALRLATDLSGVAILDET
jgi:sugar diacid utilization regulator